MVYLEKGKRTGFFEGHPVTALLTGLILLTFCLCTPAQFVLLEGFGEGDEAPPDGPVVVAQQPSQLTASGLLTEANRMIGAGQHVTAIPYLEEYLNRMDGVDDFRVLMLVQEVRLRLARLKGAQQETTRVVELLEAYTAGPPRHRWREAHLLLATGLFEQGRFEACIDAVRNGLAGPPEGDLVPPEQEQAPQDERELRRAGLSERQLQRIERYAEGAEESFMEAAAGPEEEPEYSLAEKTELHLMLAESMTSLSMWEESIEPYRFVIEHETHEDRKSHASLQLVRALVETARHDEAIALLDQLFEGEARYNPRMNIAVISLATALYNEGQLDEALMLYRKVFSGRDYDEMRKSDPERADRLTRPRYDLDVRLRMGQTYADSNRPWEALLLMEDVVSEGKDSQHGERAFYEIMQLLIDSFAEYEQAEERGLAFIRDRSDGVAPRQIAYLLTVMYYRNEQMEKIKELAPLFAQWTPSDDPVIVRYECELDYMQAVADLMLLDYQAALDGFDALLERYPGSHQEENARYWRAAALLFLQRYEDALASFDAYLEGYPEGNWTDAASFRRGVALFGLERYDEAETQFSEVIERWPDSAVLADALSLRGDLYGARGELDEAVEQYRAAMQAARRIQQVNYAFFQMVEVFDAEARHDEILAAIESYLDTHGEEADIARAMYWVGRTRMEQGRDEEAVAAYLDTVLRFGEAVQADGVDLIINELARLSVRRLELELVDELTARVRDGIEQQENETLRLRLRALLAKIEGTEAEFGRELVGEIEQLEQVPPPVLALISRTSVELADYRLAEPMLYLFQTRYSDSPFLRSVLELAAAAAMDEGNADRAMELAEEAQAQFGVDPEMAWAQLVQGRILFERGEIDAARDAFMMVFNVREWRGSPYAEATYMLGRVEEAAGHPREAFGWYQRAYFQFKGHAGGHWAAEAYLASARTLQQMGRENDRRNTFRAMLFDPFVNTLPQAETARRELGPTETASIEQMIREGVRTNVTVSVETEQTL